MLLCLCFDDGAVSFLGILISFLGTVGILEGGLDHFIEIRKNDGKYRLFLWTKTTLK